MRDQMRTEDVNDSSTILGEGTVRFAFNIEIDNQTPLIGDAYADENNQNLMNNSSYVQKSQSCKIDELSIVDVLSGRIHK